MEQVLFSWLRRLDICRDLPPFGSFVHCEGAAFFCLKDALQANVSHATKVRSATLLRIRLGYSAGSGETVTVIT